MLWLLLTRDPLWFRGDIPTNIAIFMSVIPLFIGLRVYSIELSGDTARFLYSQPVKWWQIWLSKVLSGVILSVGLYLLSSAVYAVAIPAQYRLLLSGELIGGIRNFAIYLLLPYVVGLSVSGLMPGTALSFASLIIAILAFVGPAFAICWFGMIANVRFDYTMGRYLLYLGPISVFVGGALVARILVKLNLKGRWFTWFKIPVVLLVIATMFSVLHIPSHFGLPMLGYQSQWYPAESFDMSPNGEWLAYRIARFGQPDRIAFANTATHRIESTWVEDGLMDPHAWSDNSERFAYMSNHGDLKIVRMNSTPSIERSLRLLHPSQCETILSWSPTGDRVCVFEQHDPVGKSHVITVDIRTGEVHATTYNHSLDIQAALNMPAGAPIPVSNFLAPAGTPASAESFLFWPPGGTMR
jgi:hypothetical protein